MAKLIAIALRAISSLSFGKQAYAFFVITALFNCLFSQTLRLEWPVTQVDGSFPQPQVLLGYGTWMKAPAPNHIHAGIDIPALAGVDKVVAPFSGFVRKSSDEGLTFFPCATIEQISNCSPVFDIGHLTGGKLDELTDEEQIIPVFKGDLLGFVKDNTYLGVALDYPDHIHFSYDYDLSRPEHIKTPLLEMAIQDPGNHSPVIEEIFFVPDDYATETKDPKAGIIREDVVPTVSGKLDIVVRAYDYMDATYRWQPINDFFRSSVYKIQYAILSKQGERLQEGGWVFTGALSGTVAQRDVIYHRSSSYSTYAYIVTNAKVSSVPTSVSEVDADPLNPNFESFLANSWDTTGKDIQGRAQFPDGEYTIRVTAFDAAGNKSTKERLVRVLNHPIVAESVRVVPENLTSLSPTLQLTFRTEAEVALAVKLTTLSGEQVAADWEVRQGSCQRGGGADQFFCSAGQHTFIWRNAFSEISPRRSSYRLSLEAIETGQKVERSVRLGDDLFVELEAVITTPEGLTRKGKV